MSRSVVHRSHARAVAVLLTFASLAASSPAQPAADKANLVGPEPTAICERAVRQSLDTPGVASPEVAFGGAPVVDRGLSNDAQLVLRGTGRARSAAGVRTFNYSCTVDLRTADAVGLVLRDTIAVAAKPEARAKAPTEPDLSHLSPAACESSAVQALKQRWPRVSQITFDTATRRFLQDSDSRAELHGRGRALPAPDADATLFGFDCEIDPRDGRVLATRLSG